MEEETKRKGFLARGGYLIATVGFIVTVFMAVAVIYYGEELRDLQHYGYIGAFLISILGGATIIVPVPMLAVVFALGGVMPHPWLVAVCAAAGEVVGALSIYMTGHGAGRVLVDSNRGLVQRSYERLLGLMAKRGSLTLFVVASVINPFFYPAALAAGALQFGLKKYCLIVFAGKLVKSMTVVYIGYWGIHSILQAIGISFG